MSEEKDSVLCFFLSSSLSSSSVQSRLKTIGKKSNLNSAFLPSAFSVNPSVTLTFKLFTFSFSSYISSTTWLAAWTWLGCSSGTVNTCRPPSPSLPSCQLPCISVSPHRASLWISTCLYYTGQTKTFPLYNLKTCTFYLSLSSFTVYCLSISNFKPTSPILVTITLNLSLPGAFIHLYFLAQYLSKFPYSFIFYFTFRS